MARIGKSRGLSHLSALDPKPEIIRYEKETPGEMIHIDIKKLGRIEGLGHRITPSGRLQAIACRAMGDRTGQSTPRSRKEGGKGWRVMTDNRVSFRSHRHAKAVRMLAIKHKRTKPYTPQDQRQSRAVRSDIPARMGLAKPYAQSDQRRDALEPFLKHYNHHRPHFGPKGKTPISRIPSNNLSRHDS